MWTVLTCKHWNTPTSNRTQDKKEEQRKKRRKFFYWKLFFNKLNFGFVFTTIILLHWPKEQKKVYIKTKFCVFFLEVVILFGIFLLLAFVKWQICAILVFYFLKHERRPTVQKQRKIRQATTWPRKIHNILRCGCCSLVLTWNSSLFAHRNLANEKKTWAFQQKKISKWKCFHIWIVCSKGEYDDARVIYSFYLMLLF